MLSGVKSQFPQTDPCGALRHAHVLYTKVDAQCDKLQVIELSWQHLRQSMCRGEIFLSPEFWTKFQRDIPSFLAISAFPHNAVY